MNSNLYRPLPTAEEMAAWDGLSAGKYRVPTLMLMENAARAALQVLREERLIRPGIRVLILAGGGNNGGDGIALGRHLHDAGCRVQVYTLPAPGKYKDISRRHLDMARLAGTPVEKLRFGKNGLKLPKGWEVPADTDDSYPGAGPDVIIDALVGAGFKSPLRGQALDLVRWMGDCKNASGCVIMSLDIPSGLGSLSGRPEPEAVRADITVSFAAAKPGLVLPWAREYTGRLMVREIGMPSLVARDLPPSFRLVAPRLGVLDLPIPMSHKGLKGKVLVMGGSSGLTGAPALCALGALRGGAGLVTMAGPKALCPEMKTDHPEIMTLQLGGPDSREWDEGMVPRLVEFISGMGQNSALALGPGLGRGPRVTRFIAAFLKALKNIENRPPLILDADGLYPFRLAPDENSDELGLELLGENDVITPHAGEIRRIMNLAPGEADLDELPGRARVVDSFCGKTGSVLLLKGPGTLIGQGRTALTASAVPVALVPYAESNLAVGGSGDVLSGLIAALMARGLSTLDATALGAYLHGRAGVLSRVPYPAGGNIPQDIAFYIPDALAELY